MVGGSEGTSQYPEAPGLSELQRDPAPESLSCSSLSVSLEGEMKTVSMADVPESLRCSGVEGAAGGAAGGVEAGGAPAGDGRAWEKCQ